MTKKDNIRERTKTMMIYDDFLTTIKQNTDKNELYEYKELCRFCLNKLCVENPRYGIDITDNDSRFKQQRNGILNNYNIITKQYLPISKEYPNFVCSECETELSHNALFIQKIEQNANNWERFLRSDNEANDVNVFEKYRDEDDEFTVKYERIEEIEIELCDQNDENACETETNIFDDLMDVKPTLLKVEAVNVPPADGIESTAKRKRRTKTPRFSYANSSIEFERTCKHCDVPTFSSLIRLYSHHRSMHPGVKISSCDICGAGFMSKHAVISHMNERHTMWGKKHQCQFCSKLFYSDREVKGHEKIHLNAQSYVCNLCGRRFNTKTRLNMHLKSKVHNANYKPVKYKKYPKKYHHNAKKVYRCEQCVPSTVYASAEERADHRNVMHKIYECEICKNGFLTPESLNSHKLLHSSKKPRPHVCSVCKATFNQSSHLSSHFKRKHTDEKTHQCSFCDKKFFENFELTSHINLIHRKQQRVKCPDCELDFVTDKVLQSHIQYKHSDNVTSPYDCKICGKRNVSFALMQLHRRKHHKNDE